jgi:hypothetical protein
LLLGAFRRIVDASDLLGYLGIIVDAKDEAAERFYAVYDFVPRDGHREERARAVAGFGLAARGIPANVRAPRGGR